MTERCGWAWRATREVIVDEQQIDRNFLEERQSGQTRTACTPFRAGVRRACSIPCIMTGSAVSILDFPRRIRPAIGPAVNSDNLRIIGPLFFVYKEWPWGERRLSLLGIAGILQAVSSLASPRCLHYPRWGHGRPVQLSEPIAVRTCEKPGDAGLRYCLDVKTAWFAHNLKIRLFEKRRGTRTIGNASEIADASDMYDD
jgi:hypothetical protein